jgi:hypothetical protein
MTDLTATVELDQAVKSRYLDGGTIASVAAALGVSQGEVRRSLRRSNVPIRTVGHRPRRPRQNPDTLDAQAVVTAYLAGHSASALAQAHQVDYRVIRDLLASRGVLRDLPHHRYPGPDQGLIVDGHWPRLNAPDQCPDRRRCAKVYHAKVTEDRCPCCGLEFGPGPVDRAWTPLPLGEPGPGTRRLWWRKTLTDASTLLCRPIRHRWQWEHLNPAGEVVYTHTADRDGTAKQSAQAYLASLREGGDPAHEPDQRGPIWRSRSYPVPLTAPQLLAAHTACTSYQQALAAAGVTGPTVCAVANAVAVLASRLHAAGIDVAAAAVGLDQADAVATATVDQPDRNRS